MTDLIAALEDLHKQATTERSHYYTAKVLTRTIAALHDLTSEKWWANPDHGPLFRREHVAIVVRERLEKP